MRDFARSVRNFCCDDGGTTAIEYLFMLSLVVFAAMIGISLIGAQTKVLFDRTKDAMP